MLQRPPLDETLRSAVERRRALLSAPDTSVARVFDGEADGIPGLVIERLGPALVVQLHQRRLGEKETELRHLMPDVLALVGASCAYRKYFPHDRTRLTPELELLNRLPEPWVGSPAEAEFEVLEHGRRFLVHAFDGFGTGLFLDHRERRDRVASSARGQRVLNAFAYTCGFGVAAGLGAAEHVVNVDISKRYLEWGKRNIELNGLSLDAQRFICSDIFDYYGRARRQRAEFDLIILDPPTFARSGPGGRVFSVVAHLDDLLVGALSVLRTPGTILLSVNHETTTISNLKASALAVAKRAGRRVAALESLAAPIDFPSNRGASRAIMAGIQ